MQVTGKTNLSTINTLSIQINLNGLSFLSPQSGQSVSIDYRSDSSAISNLVSGQKTDVLRACIATEKYILLPEEVYDPAKQSLYLQTKGFHASAGETLLSNSYQDFRILFIVDKPTHELILSANRVCGEVDFFHIFTRHLRYGLSLKGQHLLVSLSENRIFVTLSENDRLLFAEDFAVEDDTMIPDFISLVQQQTNASKAKVTILNDFDNRTKKAAKNSKHYQFTTPGTYYNL